MKDKFTEEEIKKALEQANANMDFEEVNILTIEKEKTKVLRIDLNDKRNRRPN